MCSDKKMVFPVHPLKDWNRNLIAQSIQFSLEDMDLIRERRQEPNDYGWINAIDNHRNHIGACGTDRKRIHQRQNERSSGKKKV